MQRLQVKTSKLHFILVILLGLFFVPLGSMIVINGLLKGRVLAPLVIGTFSLGGYALVVWAVRRGHGRSVRSFSEEGLLRNDGRQFLWTDLSRVVNQIRINPKFHTRGIWRTEIHFRNGECAWVIPLKVSNYREVSEYVRRLPCEHTETRA